MSTYYELLGVTPSASLDEIKKAYRRQSLTSHPDRNQADPSSTARFQSIGKAYSILMDKNERRKYDMSIQIPTEDNTYESSAHAFTHSPPRTHYGREHTFVVHAIKPPAIEVNLKIGLLQAYTGCTESVSVKRWIVENGTGKREERETLYIAVPKGADDGEIIVLKDKGHYSSEGISGDVKVFLSVANDSKFCRRGLDLIYEHTITLKEALCGFSFDLRHINEKSFMIQNPKGCIVTPNYRKIIPKLGMQRDGHTGNLMIDFKVVFPSCFDLEVVDQLEGLL